MGTKWSRKRKPNIVSVGWSAVYANISGIPTTGNGTSYANPNIAGLIACLWQAFPEFSNMEILDAVEKSSDRYNNPDERFGNGIPNFRIAYAILQAKRQLRLTTNILKTDWIKAFPVPITTTFTVLLKAPASANAHFKLVDVSGRIVQAKRLTVEKDNYYYISFAPPIAPGTYYLHYADGKNKATLKLTKR